jgi:hypothetical protein
VRDRLCEAHGTVNRRHPSLFLRSAILLTYAFFSFVLFSLSDLPFKKGLYFNPCPVAAAARFPAHLQPCQQYSTPAYLASPGF